MTPSSQSHLKNILQVGHWFSHAGKAYEITGWNMDNLLVLRAREHPSGETREFLLAELFSSSANIQFAPTLTAILTCLAQPDTQAVAAHTVSDVASLPDPLIKQADTIITVVEKMMRHESAYRNLPSTNQPHPSLTEWMRQGCELLDPPIGLSTYYKYRRTYETHHGLRAEIAAAMQRSTHGKTKLTAQQQDFVSALVQTYYKSNPPMRLQTVYAIAQQVWQHTEGWWVNVEKVQPDKRLAITQQLLDVRQSIKPLLADPAQAQNLTPMRLLSRSRFYTYVKQLVSQPSSGAEIQITRHGAADWEQSTNVFDHFAATATLPLQYVFADHYKLDVLHVDDDMREELGRLWLTVLIDAFSRAILGIYLGYESPSIESIQGALRHAIWPKSDLAQWGIDQVWETFGVPQRLFVDNAWAHLSYSMEDLIRSLSSGGNHTRMELVFRPPYVARYGGLIERLFGNISGQIRELLPGALLKPSERHWHNASKNACLLYRDIARIMNQIVVNYMHTPHSELGRQTPHERWLAGLRLAMPNLMTLTPELERAFWRLYPKTRQVTHHGIGLFGMHFWNSELGSLQGLNLHAQKRQFHVRYNPLDISRLAVFERGLWIGDVFPSGLRLPDGSYESVSLWELQMAKDLAKTHGQVPALRTHSWLVHILEVRELIERRKTEKVSIRRKVQQIREYRKQHTVAQTDTLQLPDQIVLAEGFIQYDPRDSALGALKEML